MPRKHESTAYSTADLNEGLRRMRSRQSRGPKNVALCALILQGLMYRWRTSGSAEDRHLLRLIESVIEQEDRIKSLGGDVWQELERPRNGLFGALLERVTFQPLSPRPLAHDPKILQSQYNELRRYIKHHYPLPEAPTAHNTSLRQKELVKRMEDWLTVSWNDCGQALRAYPCECQYRTEAPTYATLYRDGRYTTPSDLFHRLLAHLHWHTPAAVRKDLTPFRRHVLERRR